MKMVLNDTAAKTNAMMMMTTMTMVMITMMVMMVVMIRMPQMLIGPECGAR